MLKPTVTMNGNNPKIVFIHSLNNFTGSPNVLSVVVRGFVERGYPVEVITSRGEGFLSGIEGVAYRYTCYRWTGKRMFTLLRLLLSQISLFFHLLFSPRKGTVYYINTIIPFGAALACRLSGKNFVYHIHENMRQGKTLYHILRNVYRWCNRRSIFVSDYVRSTAAGCRDGIVAYNALDEEFTLRAAEYMGRADRPSPRKVLMVSSLRKFKGIYEFAELARRLPQYEFELVLSASPAQTKAFALDAGRLPNLSIYPVQTDLHPFYHEARVLLQLSYPEQWVETFGLTILEGMAYGVPGIVPPVGGPAELVADGESGYTVDPHDMTRLSELLTSLMEDDALHERLSRASLERVGRFSREEMMNKIERYVSGLTSIRNN